MHCWAWFGFGDVFILQLRSGAISGMLNDILHTKLAIAGEAYKYHLIGISNDQGCCGRRDITSLGTTELALSILAVRCIYQGT
jgi:hypothetical protein